MTARRVGHLLDDPVSIQTADGSGMLAVAGTLGEQLQHGFTLGKGAGGLPSPEGIGNVVVCGMGGSGVTGDVLRATLSRTLRVPIVTTKGYVLPSFCGPDTLVLAVSYSGNTEETVAAYREAITRRCRVVVIASGGALLAAARENGVPTIPVSPDVLAPRAALGYLVGAALAVLERVGLGAAGGAEVETVQETLDHLVARVEPAQPVESNSAKQIAAWLRGATPLVWATEGVSEAAAVRWKTQLNENAKVPAFWGVLPEVDHNEVEGWFGEGNEPYRVIILRNEAEAPRMHVRVRATVDAMAAVGLETREVWAEGSSPLEQTLSLILVGDFVSIYLAVLRGIDPTPIPILTGLKERRAALGANE